MLAASLKHKITIESRSRSLDALGSVTYTYSTLAERRASIKHLSGAKNYESDLEQSVNDYRVVFQFRYLPDLDYDCRIKFDDDIYVIQDIEKLFRRVGHRVVCERRVNQD